MRMATRAPQVATPGTVSKAVIITSLAGASGAQVEGARRAGGDLGPAGLAQAGGQRLVGARQGPGHVVAGEELPPAGIAAVEEDAILGQRQRGVGVQRVQVD